MDHYPYRRGHRAAVRRLRAESAAGSRGVRAPGKAAHSLRTRFSFPVRRRAAHWSVAPLYLLAALGFWNLRLLRPVSAQNSPATVPQAVAPALDAEQIRGARIRVDTWTLDQAAGNAYTACGLKPPAGSDKSVWESWCSLSGPRLSASSSVERLPVFAARIPEGVAALVVNHSAATATFHLAVRLGRGVYTVERLVFQPDGSGVRPEVERLSSIVMGGTGTPARPGALAAGWAAIYRLTNRSAETSQAFRALEARLRQVRRLYPAEWRRLQAPLRECADNVGALSDGILPGRRYDKLKHIHRALLTLAHAESLCANFHSQGGMAPETQEALADDLAHVEEALTELSVGCLNLAPRMTVEAPDPSQPGLRKLTVSVTNLGAKAVSLVRLGAEAPRGAVVSPDDQAMFESLEPGQTVHATFYVRFPEETEPHGVAAEISYFTDRAPAHLRLRDI